MSDLIVVAYPDMHRASEVKVSLLRMEKEHLIDLEDSCIVTKDAKGKIKVQQSFPLTAMGAVDGGFWGGLIGLLFLHPLLGVAVGMSAGGIGAMLSDYGINDGFVKGLSEKLEPESSAIFLLVQKMTPDKVLVELAHFGGHVLQTSLTAEEEARLESALQNAAPTGVNLAEGDLERVLEEPVLPDLDDDPLNNNPDTRSSLRGEYLG